MYYRLKTSLFFNYEIDWTLDKAIRLGVESGIEKIYSKSNYFAVCIFKNGTEFTFWNVNRYHAWIARGEIKFREGYVYEFSDCRPSAKTMYKFMQELKK
jgi:hypothetical protein